MRGHESHVLSPVDERADGTTVYECVEPGCAGSTRADWLAWRRQGIGASDVAAILGISPWSSPWSVWADKVGLLEDANPSTVMEAGQWLELAVAPWFAHRTGLHVAGEQTWLSHPSRPWMRCTLDGFVVDDVGSDPDIGAALGGLEIKTSRPGRVWDEVPAHYEAQGQWQMAVANLERVWFAVLMGRRLDVHVLERDEADIELMVERAEAFWQEHVLTGVPPATDGHEATLRALAEAYPAETPGRSVPLDELVPVLEVWQESKDRKRLAVEVEKQCAAEIQAALGDAEEGTVDGERAVSWRSQTRKAHVVPESTFRVLRPCRAKESAR